MKIIGFISKLLKIYFITALETEKLDKGVQLNAYQIRGVIHTSNYWILKIKNIEKNVTEKYQFIYKYSLHLPLEK